MSYTRTPAGTAAVLNPKIGMPRQLKALLLAMNGRFDPHNYASKVPGGLAVASMLETLIKDGYVKALSDVDFETVGFVSTRPALLNTLLQSDDLRAVHNAVGVMTDFAMQHLPNEALEISFALENFTTIAQLEASLGAYEKKIRHLGAPSTIHLEKLQGMLHPG